MTLHIRNVSKTYLYSTSSTSAHTEVLQYAWLNHGVRRRFRGVSDTVLTQHLVSLAALNPCRPHSLPQLPQAASQ